MECTPAQEAAALQLGEEEKRRDQRIGDVGREIELQPVEPEHPAEDPANQQMESVERLAADEDAAGDGRRLSCGSAALGAQSVDLSTQANEVHDVLSLIDEVAAISPPG